MYLADTNVFLEILLAQNKLEECKRFLNENLANLYISDFSLHSIGVILFRNNKETVFQKFVNDVLPSLRIITLLNDSYKDLREIKKNTGLDFDDAYHYKIAHDYNLRLVTMDEDFKKVQHKIKIVFL